MKKKKASISLEIKAFFNCFFFQRAVRTGLEPDIAHNLIFKLLHSDQNFSCNDIVTNLRQLFVFLWHLHVHVVYRSRKQR